MINQHYILVAEDDADDRFLLQTALKETGFTERVVFAENGVELMNQLDTIQNVQGQYNYPTFILLDLNMPKMDGREALKKIKTNDLLRKIPVIVFSTTKNQTEVKRCYDLGANTYIVKPVTFDNLLEIIRQIRQYWMDTATLIGYN